MQAPQPDDRDRQTYYLHATPLRRAAVAALRLVFGLLMELKVEGAEHLPANGPAILAANHVTNFDVFPMQLSLARPIFFMGKSELFAFPPLAAILRNLGGFPVYRGENDGWAMRHAARVLAAGQVLGMFPEGTRSKGRGLAAAKTGAARLAIENACPLVPLAVVGSDGFFREFPQRAPVSIRLLPPLVAGPADTPAELTERLMYALASALPERMRGAYARVPAAL
jgi:1-acyl-sn-glycerol-3-phosphate acyltransferase